MLRAPSDLSHSQPHPHPHRHHNPKQVRVLTLSSIILVFISTTLLLFTFTARCDHHDESATTVAAQPTGRPSYILQNNFARQNTTTRGESQTSAKRHADLANVINDQLVTAGRVGRSRPLHRLTRRWAAASRKPRVQLAQRPPKSTTTTTTTSSTTTSTTEEPSKIRPADNSDEEEESAESAGDTGDYEEIGRAKQKSPPSGSTTQAAPSEAAEGDEEGAEEEVEEQEDVTTTTTTTTTPKPRKSTGGVRRKSSKRPPTFNAGNEEQPSKSAKPSGKTKLAAASVESDDNKMEPEETLSQSNKTAEAGQQQSHKKRALLHLPFIRPKNTSSCTPEAYKEFPRDLIGDKWRARGGVLVHVAVVCYMFYSLALVCERYFMPSLEEFAQRLQLSEDVAGATLMSAGSSAPELFTAILGVFVAKGDVGTGAIVGSAVFNILFVIGLCAFVSTTTAQLQWWPVLRDSVYYTFTVLVLILIIYDERITAFESASMIVLYGVYIAIMAHNEQIKQIVSNFLLSYPLTAKLIGSGVGQSGVIQVDGLDDVFGTGSTSSMRMQQSYELNSQVASSKTVEEDSIFMAALLVIVKHKRLFRSQLRFQSAARYIIIKRQHRAMRQQQRQLAANEEVNYFGPDSDDGPTMAGGGGSGALGHSAAQRAKMAAYARSATTSKQKFSIVSKDDYEFWHRPPDEHENYYLWLARIPINYVLHYSIPDCTLYPDKYIITFFVSIVWTAIFSYIMVWMVTLIGYTLGIPDSVMGVTFLAAGTSVPDCYSSLHAARNGMADMAVSNSIGSNVFDILIGLSVPWFIQSAIYPGVVATVNSRGVIYSVILLFLSLIVTIYLLNKYNWSLQPRLGLALLIAYGLFIILTSMLEFNMFGHVNPPPC